MKNPTTSDETFRCYFLTSKILNDSKLISKITISIYSILSLFESWTLQFENGKKVDKFKLDQNGEKKLI